MNADKKIEALLFYLRSSASSVDQFLGVYEKRQTQLSADDAD